jgi:hypothetical protein
MRELVDLGIRGTHATVSIVSAMSRGGAADFRCRVGDSSRCCAASKFCRSCSTLGVLSLAAGEQTIVACCAESRLQLAQRDARNVLARERSLENRPQRFKVDRIRVLPTKRRNSRRRPRPYQAIQRRGTGQAIATLGARGPLDNVTGQPSAIVSALDDRWRECREAVPGKCSMTRIDWASAAGARFGYPAATREMSALLVRQSLSSESGSINRRSSRYIR